MLDLGVEYGGERVVTTYFTNGERQAMLAGRGGTVALGVLARPHAASPLGLRATAGYKFVLTAADNANIRLTRIPVELVGTYRFTPDVWAGAGYAGHYAIRLDGDGFGPDVDFDNAHGATAEIGWRWLALTYTRIGYTDEFGDDFDASSVGASVIVKLFPR